MNKRLSKKIFWLNFIFSIMIVSYHTYNIPIYGYILEESNLGQILIYYENFITCIERVAVPSFFFMSAYLFFVNYKPKMAVRKLKSRVRSLLVPYLLWNFISWLFYFVITHSPYISEHINLEMNLSIAGVIYEIVMGKYNALWFVRILLLLDLMAPLLYFLLNGKIKSIIVISILVITEFIFNMNEFSLLYGSIFFCMGAIFALNFQKYFMSVFKKSVLMLLAFFILCIFLSQEIQKFEPRILEICLLFFVILFWYGSDFLINFLPDKTKAPWFVQNSFFIYCSHGMILESVEKIILITAGMSLYGAFIDYFFSPVLTIIIIILFEFILFKNFTGLWKILNGGRGGNGIND